MEISRLQMEVVCLKHQIEITNSQLKEKQRQVESTQNELEHTRQQMTTAIFKLDEKQSQMNSLSGQLDELKLENREKNVELKLKNDEIQALKKNSGNSQRDFLSEELKSKQEKLENFATELGIGLPKTQNLCKRYRELILARDENRSNDVHVAQENIEATREGLLERGISNSKVRKFCRKCKKTAQLEV